MEKIELLEEIEKTRYNLVKKGIELGLHHPLVVEKSQRLDILLNQYMNSGDNQWLEVNI